MTIESYKPQTADEISALEIYLRLLDACNEQDAHKFGHLFSGTAYLIGFDGTQMIGQSQVEGALKKIFANHNTGKYKAKVRDIRHLDRHCLLLFAITGIIPTGGNLIDPTKIAFQSMVVCKSSAGWFIELFQNTPAEFQGRPDEIEVFTNELMELV
ncbi:MAG: SgcJ/EcaC family oxidoreductase [Ferruginibacter sp.]